MATAAKSLQSCPTLCNPRDGSPPGSPVPGILQARTLEWVAISFSDAGKWKVKVKSLGRVRLLVTPWTAAYQAPLSMGFSRQEYWSGVPLPSLLYKYNILFLCTQYSRWIINRKLAVLVAAGKENWVAVGNWVRRGTFHWMTLQDLLRVFYWLCCSLFSVFLFFVNMTFNTLMQMNSQVLHLILPAHFQLSIKQLYIGAMNQPRKIYLKIILFRQYSCNNWNDVLICTFLRQSSVTVCIPIYPNVL